MVPKFIGTLGKKPDQTEPPFNHVLLYLWPSLHKSVYEGMLWGVPPSLMIKCCCEGTAAPHCGLIHISPQWIILLFVLFNHFTKKVAEEVLGGLYFLSASRFSFDNYFCCQVGSETGSRFPIYFPSHILIYYYYFLIIFRNAFCCETFKRWSCHSIPASY